MTGSKQSCRSRLPPAIAGPDVLRSEDIAPRRRNQLQLIACEFERVEGKERPCPEFSLLRRQPVAISNSNPVSITRAVEATPFPLVPNLCVSYPHFEDWKTLYHPPSIPVWDEQGFYRYSDKFEPLYQGMKRSHEKQVFKNLDIIKHWATGRAVLSALKARSSYSVHIFPFDFLPRDHFKVTSAAQTRPITLPQSAEDRARGTAPRGTVCRNGACEPSLSNKESMSADVFYTASRIPDDYADSLLHELVHAARLISGVFRFVELGGSYGNNEEFYANTIQMIYRSQRQLPIYDYHNHPFDPAKFLESKMARNLLVDLQDQQPAFFSALANVNAAFNPIKQIDDEGR
jgi:hypothetical protein